MNFNLDQNDQAQIKGIVFSVIQDAVKQAGSTRPYLNRKDIARYFGVSESTIGNWAKLGMPIAIVDGRKLYGKQSITQWLKDHEKPNKAKLRQIKKLATISGSYKQK